MCRLAYFGDPQQGYVTFLCISNRLCTDADRYCGHLKGEWTLASKALSGGVSSGGAPTGQPRRSLADELPGLADDGDVDEACPRPDSGPVAHDHPAQVDAAHGLQGGD